MIGKAVDKTFPLFAGRVELKEDVRISSSALSLGCAASQVATGQLQFRMKISSKVPFEAHCNENLRTEKAQEASVLRVVTKDS